MTCTLCSRRPAKRACPALRHRICATCCATKRLVEIRCPSDCTYLEASQRHPAAVVRRQQEQDLSTLMVSMGQRLSELQLHTFFLIASVIVRHTPDGLAPLADSDVADAAEAMAGTLEAAGHGLIAELQSTSATGEPLRRQIKDLLMEIGKGGGSRFERDAAIVLRGIERGARHVGEGPGGAGWDGPMAYLELLRRVLPPPPEERPEERSGIVLP